MMHYSDTIITLTDVNGKPFREYEANKQQDGRKCKVIIPFESEYKVYIKNPNPRRIRLEIEIDGTRVTGPGLILAAGATEYIERFIDVAKKFKFVRAGHEAVSDPTSKENGVLKVRVTKEKDPEPTPKVVEHHHHHWDYNPWWPNNPHNPSWYNQIGAGGPTYGSNAIPDNRTFKASEIVNQLSPSVHFTSCYLGPTAPTAPLCGALPASMPTAQPGATIEGGVSSQTFGTTKWLGDLDVPFFFTFQISGSEDPDYIKYLELQKRFG